MISSSTVVEKPATQKESEKPEKKIQIVWLNLIYLTYLHIIFIYALYLIFTTAHWKTVLFAYIYGNIGVLGITAGVHRLWSHRSYKAKLPLRILLCCFASIAAQTTIYKWSRIHRVHHKYVDTDADPHNIKRGFFYAHVGWQLCKKHPDVTKKGKTISLEDLWNDPIVRFNMRFYIPMYSVFCYLLPTMIPVWCWSETVWNSFHIAAVARYCYSLNITWLVNSAAHTFGNKPFDKYQRATENVFASFLMNGEGWHNYHHTFPWDYSASELGYMFNFTKLFIDFMAFIGQAYDLKSASPETIRYRKLKTGDGSRMN